MRNPRQFYFTTVKGSNDAPRKEGINMSMPDVLVRDKVFEGWRSFVGNLEESLDQQLPFLNQ